MLLCSYFSQDEKGIWTNIVSLSNYQFGDFLGSLVHLGRPSDQGYFQWSVYFSRCFWSCPVSLLHGSRALQHYLQSFFMQLGHRACVLGEIGFFAYRKILLKMSWEALWGVMFSSICFLLLSNIDTLIGQISICVCL